MRRSAPRTLFPLAGSALLAAFSVAAIPLSRGLFRAPRTPYDASEAAHIAVPAWIVLQRAESLVPRGSSVVVQSEPADPSTDSYLHRFAVALLPGRRIVPAALWSVPTDPAGLLAAEYVAVVGPDPSPPPGALLLRIPEGSVWRRP